MPRIFENPNHWRQRAEEARGVAAHCNNSETRKLMLGIALAYDDLAERANSAGNSTKPRLTSRTNRSSTRRSWQRLLPS